ncbi:hypothetical protein PHYBLDRAFT_178566 [Phycomyces blakesleeanus NRRL 1555(-)]|uniref:Uncharacterized protein n=1 Tax=Phycomyces blakesleeanus (strain ATCC 8743b / DSM 1359 / FGSC 10004 / NBRC 33097 / NRRL 1555) TaxID=763407 RepID=A0A167QWF9_PHYB8|nr:hypothetical protein PHYBLDRAFT_178566 [Phycomyces blakesleeanus NRRL 1555(-)]OAD80381.1 hypothetical protein PHYBLDRAFT_178566 [Phycomyces blakesleeanus NRRL 1555(-)]|eukprot:XP_018298421.1 hypothetical protein PHYBLDRAFT_178566 [Phycomyces blakesleeanus NRRL 1555(-)]
MSKMIPSTKNSSESISNERRFLETDDDDVARIGDSLGYAAQILYRFGIPLGSDKNIAGDRKKKNPKSGNGTSKMKTTGRIDIPIENKYEDAPEIQQTPQAESDATKLTSKETENKRPKRGITFRRGRGRPLKFSLGRGRPRKLYSGTTEKNEAKAQSLQANYLILYS